MNDELLSEMNDRLKKIESYLYNDHDTGKDGIVKMQERLEHRVFILEEQEKIKKAKSATWGVVGALGFTGLWKVLELIFK